MRPHRPLAVIVFVLVVTACTSAKPGWTYAPAPSATPLPSVEASASAPAASPSASAPAGESPAGSPAAGGTVLEIQAQGVAFDTAELTAPAGQPFQIHFVNNDASIQHNVAIHEGSPTGPEVFRGEIFVGPGERTYDVPALAAGAFGFICTVHPNMTGTLTVQ
jgi:plastocyanin